MGVPVGRLLEGVSDAKDGDLIEVAPADHQAELMRLAST